MGPRGNEELGSDRWGSIDAVTRPALRLGRPDFLDHLRWTLSDEGVLHAVGHHDSAVLFDWLLGIVQFQGISDANASAFTEKHGPVGWTDIASALEQDPACRRLQSYWQFDRCRFRKAEQSCSEPLLLPSCPLPTHPFRNGRLSQGAYSLFLFIRDVCDGDLVGWIDERLAAADEPGHPERPAIMRRALLEPLGQVYGVSNKVLSMALADLLLTGDPSRERWITTGSSMVAIDTLIHNFLHRTGVLRRLEADHAYGPECYAPGGCSSIIENLARRIDAREFNPDFAACFPRFVQHAIWQFCAQSRFNICNGNQIDDRQRCENNLCPAFEACDRISLNTDVN